MSINKNGSPSSDFFRNLYRITNYWLLFLISLVVSLALAFAYVRYTEKEYKITTSILLTDNTSKDSGMEILFKDLGIGGGKKNLENEVEILKSFGISKKAIHLLDFKVFYFAEGNILTSEVYRQNPFTVQIDTVPKLFAGIPIYIKKIGAHEYMLHDRYENNYYDPQAASFTVSKKDKLPSRCTLRFGIGYPIGKSRFKIDCNESLLKEYNSSSFFYFIMNDDELLATQYKSRLKVTQSNKLSTILDLSLTGKNILKEADYLNALVKVYSDNLLEEKNRVASNTIQFIDNQLTEINISLRDAEEQLKYFRANNKIMDISFAASNAFNKLDALESEKAQIVVKRKYFDYLLNYVKSNDVLKDVVAPSAIGIDDPLLTSLIQQLSKLISERSVLALTAKEKNPAWFVLDDKIKSIKKELIENIKGIIASSQITQDDLNKRIAGLEKSVDQLPDNERQLVNIQRKFNLNDNIYTYLLQKRAEAGIARAANIPDCQVIEEATVRSSSLIAPKKLVVYAIALFFGLFIPIAISMTRIWMNDKILSKEDLESNSDIPIVGMVGNSDNFGNLVTKSNPRGAVTEDFRSIKLNLPYMQPNREIKVVCVTSSVPGEGKTFCSVNLASVYAMSGKKTLVLFGDLRRPRIDKDLDVKTDFGLSNVLIGKSALTDVIQASSVENLYVLAAGPSPPNPAELLGTERMDEVMEYLKKTFDYIVIDTPPLGLVADSLVLMKFSDATCYIVRHDYTRKLFLQKINEMYTDKKITNICLIINDISTETVGYVYGYGYRYGGYGYQQGYFEDENLPFWKKIKKSLFGKPLKL